MIVIVVWPHHPALLPVVQWPPPCPPLQVCARCVCAQGLLVQLLLCRRILGSVLWQEGGVCRLQGAELCARRVQGDGERRAGLPLPVWVQRGVLWNRWDTAPQDTSIIHHSSTEQNTRCFWAWSVHILLWEGLIFSSEVAFTPCSITQSFVKLF